jgi:hypothetical protein
MILISVSWYKSALTPKTKRILSSILASSKSYGVDQSFLLRLYPCLNKLMYPTKLFCQERSCGGWHLPVLRRDTFVARFIIMHKDECWIMRRWSTSTHDAFTAPYVNIEFLVWSEDLPVLLCTQSAQSNRRAVMVMAYCLSWTKQDPVTIDLAASLVQLVSSISSS